MSEESDNNPTPAIDSTGLVGADKNMKLKDKTLIEWLVVGAIAAILLSVPGSWVVKSHMEARAYNRLTGADATTWEAMWVELRVAGKPGQD